VQILYEKTFNIIDIKYSDTRHDIKNFKENIEYI